MEFNQNQKDVIYYGKGTLLVEAGPGSGKTTVIVERIKHLIDIGVSPETFLVITFTRKAAENLQNKLKEFLSKEDISKMQISTIHSFCLEYLKGKDEVFKLLDDDNSEKKALFIQKFKKQLGFTGPYTVFDYQIPSVISKFGEYTSFNVDSDELVRYIKENRPVSQDYLDFINSLEHFSKKRVDDNDFKDDWYNARYQRIAEAYPKYLKLLDESGYVDYDTLQLKTLEKLQEDPETPYNAILIDEFQDTDPLQFRIFEILRKNADYFTAVGDVDQHIYAFRSSFNDYFKELYEKNSPEIISLNRNYRSTRNIVKLTDSFIGDYRKEYSRKHLESANEDYDNDSFILENETPAEEAENIFNIIKHLHDEKGLEYSDIAVLYRKHYNKTIPLLVDLLNGEDIDFTIRGQADLKDQDEVKSLLTLLWYITRRCDKRYISSADELKELNLKAFCGENFEPAFWALADETKEYLKNLQESFQAELLRVENEARATQGKGKVRAVHNIKKNEDMDTLIEIFSQVEKPVVDLDAIENENDGKFFSDLENLRKEIDCEEPPTILEVYYRLVSLGDYFKDIENNIEEVNNLAALTQTIYNYESFISQTDIKGLYFFLNRAIGDYSSYLSSDGGVQLMTVHAAKGLEFPVTIVATLEKDKFPMVVKDENREKNYINGRETFYTPNEYLEYKRNISLEKENELEESEEAHIIYVAMTRAADLLILSCVGETPNAINNLKDSLKEFSMDCLDDVVVEKKFSSSDDEKLKLNYSSYSTYNLCPFMYNLIYNCGFRVSDENVTNLGTVFHEVMEKVNLKLKDQEYIQDDELDRVIQEVYESMFEIDDDSDDYNQLKESIHEYFNEYSVKQDVLESELPFEIERENYILNGAIDLIYKIGDGEIAILDYKNAEVDDHKIKHYEKQLYIYASALSELFEFNDFDIKKGETHFVKSDYTNTVVITDEKISEQMDKLNDVALKIIDEEYPKKKSNFCEYCKFRIICGD
ncbi:ATP-dependent helicase [Methanobrevibacter sp.]|uniref:ATP-dependent helicase n=1 Tax=Methanobrevibacter sp. TaxID=66852 RepID=UPI00388F6E07